MAPQKPHELYRTIPWRLYNLFTDEHREFWVTGSYNDSSKITPKPYIMVLTFVLVTHNRVCWSAHRCVVTSDVKK